MSASGAMPAEVDYSQNLGLRLYIPMEPRRSSTSTCNSMNERFGQQDGPLLEWTHLTILMCFVMWYVQCNSVCPSAFGMTKPLSILDIADHCCSSVQSVHGEASNKMQWLLCPPTHKCVYQLLTLVVELKRTSFLPRMKYAWIVVEAIAAIKIIFIGG